MSNSRLKLATRADDDKPHNSSKGKGIILETPYRPGFVDDTSLEDVKMAIDKELDAVSNALYVTTERTADTIKRIDEIKIEGDGLLAKIEEVDRVSKEADKALAERITTLKAESEAGDATLTQEMVVVSDKIGKVEAKWGVQTNVNGKISGIQLNNDGASSSFSVVADRFTISDGGAGNTIPPFEVVGGNTRIKSAFVNSLQSDNWDGAGTGWAITRDGWARFNNVTVKGIIQADSGYFRGTLSGSDITGTTGTFTGSINVTGGDGSGRMEIRNDQILIYDGAGRLRVQLGRL